MILSYMEERVNSTDDNNDANHLFKLGVSQSLLLNLRLQA